jgi:hypothetical protein
MAETEVLHAEPRHRVAAFVDDILGRADDAFDDMREQFRTLAISLMYQFAAAKKNGVDLRTVKFESVRWVKEGRIVIDLSHAGRPWMPNPYRWDTD